MQMLQLFAALALVATTAAQESLSYKDYVFQETTDRVTLIAGLVVAGFAGLMMIVIVLRDILGIWTCFGITEVKRQAIPVRTLTAMSAAYLANQETGLSKA